MTAAAVSNQSSNAVVLERIDGLRCDVSEVKGILSGHIADERKVRETYLVDHADVVAKADAAHRRLDLIEPIVIELQRNVQTNNVQLAAMNQKLGYVITILAFIGMALGAWLIGQFLGLIS
jgi:hypothetical protein